MHLLLLLYHFYFYLTRKFLYIYFYCSIIRLVINLEKENKNIVNDIKIVIDKIRPFLISDGGNLEFVKYEDNIVYVRLSGACKDCPMIDITLSEGIEQLLMNEIPEIKGVQNIDFE